MRRHVLASLVAALSLVGCKKPPPPKDRLGPIEAEVWKEPDGQGGFVRCYLIGRESNAPVRVCGEGESIPGSVGYLIHAVTPAKGGSFIEDAGGEPLAPSTYMLLPLGSSKVEAWNLGRLGTHQWIGGGKAMLLTETSGATTHVRVINPARHFDKTWDVPLSKSEGFITMTAPDDSAVLLIQKLGGELMVLVHQPAGDSYIETLDVPNSNDAGAKKFWRRGTDARKNNGQWTVDSMVTASIDWKGEVPTFEGAPLGPFEDPDVRKPKKKATGG